MTRWTLVIPMQPPSANSHVINGNHAATAARYRKLRDSFVTVLGYQGAKPSKATGKRRLVLTRLMGKGQREWDYDNWVTACKPLLDAMKPPKETQRQGCRRIVAGLGWLVDDSPRWVDVTYQHERAADGRPATRIEIEEVSE